jgi:hypothetical protein
MKELRTVSFAYALRAVRSISMASDISTEHTTKQQVHETGYRKLHSWLIVACALIYA